MSEIQRNYLSEYGKMRIYDAFYCKNKKAYRRQKERLFKNAIIELSKTPKAPYSLKKVTNANIYELVKRLAKKNANGTIANKLTVVRRGFAFIGIDITVTVKTFKPKTLHQSKFYRAKDKLFEIENVLHKKIAYLQMLTGLSYDELNRIYAVDEIMHDGKILLSVRSTINKFGHEIYFKDEETKTKFLKIRDSLIDEVSNKYNAINISNITSPKKEVYRAMKTLYFEDLRMLKTSEFDLRAVGYVMQWEAIYKEKIFKSKQKPEFKKMLVEFRKYLNIKDTRTVKKYLGINA
jgi:hypothetical protein